MRPAPQPLQLRKLDAIRARAFLARLDLKADALSAGQGVEVHARVETGAVEEILAPVLCGDHRPTSGDELTLPRVRRAQTGALEAVRKRLKGRGGRPPAAWPAPRKS